MVDESLKLRIDLDVGADADAAEVEEATLQLRDELLELDVEDVERLSGGRPPADTRALEAVLLGALVVTATQELVRPVVRAVADWLARRSKRRSGQVLADSAGGSDLVADRSIQVEVDGDVIVITDPSAEDQQRLMEAFIARHASG